MHVAESQDITDSGRLEVKRGEHILPLWCGLPQSLPSSYEGAHGYIRYSVEAMLHRPWTSKQSTHADFRVVAKSSLNSFSLAREPVEVESSYGVCCLWSRPPLTSMTVRLPVRGYVPGQVIPVAVSVENSTKSKVKYISCSISQETRWHASKDVVKRLTEKILTDVKFIAPLAQTSGRLLISVTVPPAPPTTRENCAVTDHQYILKVVSRVGRTKVKASVPIIIGTIPVKSLPVHPSLVSTTNFQC